MIENYDSVDVFIGVDVGKSEHHAVALDRSGKRLYDKALPNDEAKLRAVIRKLKLRGQVLLVVDQPETVGALPVAVAYAEGILVGYLPGLAMRRIADLHAGEAKTDARDAAIIAEAARTLPHALRAIRLEDEQVAELSLLCGFDDDLVGQMTSTSNRIRGLLMQIHPALERVLGPHLDHPAVLDLLQKYPTPTAMKAVGLAWLGTRLLRLAPRIGRRLAEEIFQAQAEQTVVVGGTHATRAVLPRLAEQLAALRRQRGHCRGGCCARRRQPFGAHHHQHARGGCSNSRAPHHGSLRQGLRHRGPPRFLRRPRSGHQTFRIIDSWRAPLAARQQSTQTSAVPLRFCGAQRPGLPNLLRP